LKRVEHVGHPEARRSDGMLSIGKLGVGQADYYLQAVEQGIEDWPKPGKSSARTS